MPDKLINHSQQPVSSEMVTEAFPAARYFQIHFEFMQEQLKSIPHKQEALQIKIHQLDNCVSRSRQYIRVDANLKDTFEHPTNSNSHHQGAYTEKKTLK